MSLKHYDPVLYTIVVAGLPISTLKGYADGEFLTVEWDSDSFTDVAGTDGGVARAKMHDRRATVTLTLLQTAEANAALAALALLDSNTDNGGGVGPFLMKDRGGNTIYAAEHCWIARTPEPTLDKVVTTREWKIRVAELTGGEGGN